MGGYNSGRRSGRSTVERCLSLDINRLIRAGRLRPGQWTASTLTWSNNLTKKVVGVIDYAADLRDRDAAKVGLSYCADGVPVRCSIALEAQPCHFGGVRWWWICPVSGRRAAKLHLPPGARLFAARQVYKLAHQSNRNAEMQCARERLIRLFSRLGGEYAITGEAPPNRPKGMHWATYSRVLDEIEQAENRHTGALMDDFERFARSARL